MAPFPGLDLQGNRLLDLLARPGPGHQFHLGRGRTFLGHREEHHVFLLAALGIGETR